MRNVIITGGSRGLGLGIACKLREVGYCAIAIARRHGEQLATAMQEKGKPGSLHFEEFDLAELPGIPALIKSIRGKFGPIYGLINNAAIGTDGLLATLRDSQIEHTIRLNTI